MKRIQFPEILIIEHQQRSKWTTVFNWEVRMRCNNCQFSEQPPDSLGDSLTTPKFLSPLSFSSSEEHLREYMSIIAIMNLNNSDSFSFIDNIV